MVCFQSLRNLSSYLVRAKLYPMEKKTGSYKCKSSKCQVCLNISETEIYSSTVTHKPYKINIALTVITNTWYILSQEHLFEHFNIKRHNGFLENVLVIFIDKADGKNHIKEEHYPWHFMALMLKLLLNYNLLVFMFYRHDVLPYYLLLL